MIRVTMPDRLVLGVFTPNEILAMLTFVLVLLNGYYAWQTRQTVSEMRRARGAAVLPKLAIKVHAVGAGVGWLRILNVGPGAAIDVSASLTLMPGGFRIDWRTHTLAPGEGRDFIPDPPDADPNELAHLDQLVARYSHVTLTANYEDALGTAHVVDQTIEIRDWWAAIKTAHEMVTHDVQAEAKDELEGIRKALDKLASEAQRHRQRGEKLAAPWRWELRIRKLPERARPLARTLARRLGLMKLS